MAMRNKIATATLACVLGVAAFVSSTPVFAGDAGAFLGGVFATKLLGNLRARTDAEQQQAGAAQRMAAQQVVPAQKSKSPEARIAELDKLAAGGYITPAEYKAKKQAILDSI